jgi:dTMP kinase
MSRGFFITFEGGEGAGKSSQMALLARSLGAYGLEIVTTREPGGAKGAEEIRALLVNGETGRWDPMSELLLYVAARREHVVRKIEPALARGAWVLCDRFADSTMAYQGYGHGLGQAPCAVAHKLTLGEFAPDLTLILDLPAELGLARARARSGAENRYERMDLAFHERLRRGFLEIARGAPERCRLIDTRGSVAEVEAMVRRTVAERFALAL